MAEQSTKENIRNTTLYTLVRHVGLTPQEVAQLRLANLHLAGKRPNISFTPSGRDEPKVVDLDLDAHRALVGWLVARPDSSSDFLFPGQGTEALDWHEIDQLVVKAEKAQDSFAEEESVAPADQPTPPEAEPTSVSDTPASEAKPMPPPSTPELGAPPPGLAGTRAPAFQPPPPTAPEEESVNIPLPTSSPKAPPPKPASAPESQPGEIPPVGAPGPTPVVAKKETAPAGSPVAKTEGSAVKKGGAPSPPKKMGKLKAQESAARRARRLSRVLVPVMVIVLILLCVGCGSGVWLIWQSETSNQLLARLGLVDTAADIFPDERDIIASLTPQTTPLSTPTLPPTSTPTLLPPTNTPVPTETSTPVPTDTPLPTDTPIPADTPVPADTPLPTDTPIPAESPTPTETPTPAMKYGAPVLLEPEDEALLNEGNLIVLRWQSVGELAPDEQYAVRLVYQFENQPTYQGTNIKETEWTVPSSLFGQIDGPEYLYEWFVVVERLNDDGSGTAISPESERRTFVWK